MEKILWTSQTSFQPSGKFHTVQAIKENLGYVSENYEEEYEQYQSGELYEKSYTLPDESVITLSEGCIECGEHLFNSQIGGFSTQQLTYNSIMNCDPEIREDLFRNIVLSGGTTMFKGFGQRLYNEMKELAPDTMKVRVIACPERQFLVWNGGATLSTLDSFSNELITKADYKEFGESVVDRKCMDY